MSIYKYEIEVETTGVIDASTEHGETIAKERFEEELSKVNIACASMNFRVTKITETT